MSNKELLEDAYTGTATLGKIFSLIGAIIGSIAFICLVIAGIYILLKKNNKIKVSGTVVMINGDIHGLCQETLGNNQYSCLLTFSFNYNGVTYQKDLNYTGNISYYVGEVIDLYISSDVSGLSLSGDTPRYVGWVLIGSGFLILTVFWINYWLSKKYKAYGALQGVSGITNTIFRR